MIGEWSHISAVGFSVDCFNIVELYVPLRLRTNFLEGRISFLTRIMIIQHPIIIKLIIISTLSDPICPHPILLYCTQLYRLPFNIFMATVVVPSTPRSCKAVPLATCPNAP